MPCKAKTQHTAIPIVQFRTQVGGLMAESAVMLQSSVLIVPPQQSGLLDRHFIDRLTIKGTLLLISY